MTENTPTIKYTFSKEEKLCHQKSIDRLFAKGGSFIAYPLRVVFFVDTSEDEHKHELPKVLTSVSKRKFKRANKRNRVKRLIREVYRLNKPDFIDVIRERELSLDIAFLYLKDELPTYHEIEKAMVKALTTIQSKIQEANNEKCTD